MRKLTLSTVVACALLSTTGFAAEEKKDEGLKVSGHVKAWYQTMDHGGVATDKGLFMYDDTTGNDWANIGAMIRASGTANDHVDIGVAFQGVTTMGTENFLAAGETAQGAFPGETGLQNYAGSTGFPFWLHELHFTYKLSQTNIKFGRQELNTPLVFTEAWNSTANSFEAAVITDTHLPDTTIQAMYIAKGNGAGGTANGAPQVFGTEAGFSSFTAFDLDNDNSGAAVMTDTNDTKGGMVVLGLTNKSLAMMPVSAWYYTSESIAAHWVQGDLKLKELTGMDISAQGIWGGMGPQNKLATHLEGQNSKSGYTQAVAGKLGINVAGATIYGALSQTTSGNLPVANIGTNFKKTKLPTAGIFNDGMVAAQPNTLAMKFGAGYKIAGINLAAAYGSYSIGMNTGFAQWNRQIGGPAGMAHLVQANLGKATTVTEMHAVASTKINEFTLKAMYIKLSNTYVPGGATVGSYGNDIVRIVISEAF